MNSSIILFYMQQTAHPSATIYTWLHHCMLLPYLAVLRAPWFEWLAFDQLLEINLLDVFAN